MSFPTTGVLDDLQGPNATPPTSLPNVSFYGFARSPLTIFSHRLTGSTGGFCDGYTTGVHGPDVEAWAPFATLPAAGEVMAMAVRLASPGGAGADAYQLSLTAPGSWELYRILDGAFTLLDTATAVIEAGDAWGLAAIDDVITGLHRHAGVWTEVIGAVDGAVTAAGRLGWLVQGQNGSFSAIGGGTYVEPPSGPAKGTVTIDAAPLAAVGLTTIDVPGAVISAVGRTTLDLEET